MSALTGTLMETAESGQVYTNNDQGASEPSRHDAWKMFNRIAHRYDFLNHFLSANRDVLWRRRLAQLLPDIYDQRALDLATGTGDQLLALYDTGKLKSGVGLDLAEEMMAIGRGKIAARGLTGQLQMLHGDAEAIPLDENSFDAVSISFGIRNVIDISRTLGEMLRILKPGGRVLILEFSLPTNVIVRKLYLLYFRKLLPRLGGLIAGDSYAYRYLNETVETFPYGEQFCALMRQAGFKKVGVNRLTLGIASIYQGDKP